MVDQNVILQIRKADAKIKEINEKIKVLNKEKSELMNEKQTLQSRLQITSHEENIDFAKGTFPWTTTVQKLLKETFHLSEFRSLQLKTINTTLSNRDCILIKPTGGGKSLCYLLPSLISGITLVVSPLVSLMYDQILMAERFGIKSASLDTSCPIKSQNEIYKCMETDAITKITYKLIFVTPEKISKSKKFKQALEKAYADKRIARFVIDEIHCCSQWGHDFRPDYNYLHILKSSFPDVPILGLTATASDNVVSDIKDILSLNYDLQLFRDNYNRPNLYYDVKYLGNDDNESKEVCNIINSRFSNQMGIVYCFSQKDCEKINDDLQAAGIKSAFYHAFLPYEDRKSIHEKWISEQIKVIVATIAFGMGIDKENVRFVIHASMSKSLENYYQESGRAGRDGKRADCILLWKLSDYFKLASNFFQERRGIENLNHMCQYGIAADKCCRTFLAKMFENHYSASDCARMCSRCTGSTPTSVDIREVYETAVGIINKVAASKNPKITGNKLVNDLSEQMKTFKTQLTKVNTGINVYVVFDQALCHLVIEGYLKLDCHFGSFKNFAYVMLGDRKLAANDKVTLKCIVASRAAGEKVKNEEAVPNVEQSNRQLASKKRKNDTNNRQSGQGNKLAKT